MGGCGDGDKRPCAAVRHSREQWDGACTEPGRWGRKCIALRCACIALQCMLQHGLCITLQHGLCIALQHGLCIALQHGLCITLQHGLCIALQHGLCIAMQHRLCIALQCMLQHRLCITLQHGLCITLQHGLCIALQHRLCIALHAMPCVASEGRGVTLHTAPRARAVAAPLRAPCNQSHALSAVQLLPWL